MSSDIHSFSVSQSGMAIRYERSPHGAEAT